MSARRAGSGARISGCPGARECRSRPKSCPGVAIGGMIPSCGSELPTGTVTFVFTDVEGSTSLLNELGAERYAEALADHRAVIREACIRNGGVEVDTQGDAFFFAFPTAPGALVAASRFTSHLAANGQVRVRVGSPHRHALARRGRICRPRCPPRRAYRGRGPGGQVFVSSVDGVARRHRTHRPW